MNTMPASSVAPGAEATLATARRPARGRLATVASDSAYVLTGWIIAVVGFALIMPLFSAGLGTVVIGVGFLLLLLVLFVAQGFATLERTRIRVVTGIDVPEPAYRRSPEGTRLRGRVWNVLSDGRRWLDLLYAFLAPIPNLVAFPIALAWWATTVVGLAYPLYDWALPYGPDNHSLADLMGFGHSATARITVNFGVGLLAALTLPFVLRLLAVVVASFGRGLLTRQRAAVLAERVSALTESRAAAASAEANALRRLERDLHDGPQQRLVRLAMDLGTAQRRLHSDPTSAGPLISGAIDQTRETLEELRALSRGIAPPVLADRGLPAALAALAARCPVPVALRTERVEAGLSSATENGAYFVVAEALTNVAKHSAATEATVHVVEDNGVLSVTVTDNGTGGAHPAKGHGLAGLIDRVHALDGGLQVHSPPGGPTVLAARLPVVPDRARS